MPCGSDYRNDKVIVLTCWRAFVIDKFKVSVLPQSGVSKLAVAINSGTHQKMVASVEKTYEVFKNKNL